MSRITQLFKYLKSSEAIAIYLKLKKQDPTGIKVSFLRHPFSIRNNPYDYATFEEVILKKGYEIDLPFQPGYIIDGGGNIGLTAAYFASRYPEASVITVEPNPENFQLLQKNTAGYPNITAVQTGIWSSTAEIIIEDLQTGNNAFTVKEVDKKVAGSFSATGIRDLMDMQSWPRIDILKLDVEGAEKEIFEKNTDQWLSRTRVLIIELHDRMKPGCSAAVFDAIGRYDFSFSILGENVVFTNNKPV